jgi:hypothetical protein
MRSVSAHGVVLLPVVVTPAAEGYAILLFQRSRDATVVFDLDDWFDRCSVGLPVNS